MVLGPCLAHCVTVKIPLHWQGKSFLPKEQSRLFDFIDVYIAKLMADLVALGRWDSPLHASEGW